MQEFTITVVSKTGHSHDYVVSALNVDYAVDRLLDRIAYDVAEVHTADHCILF